MKKVLYLGSKCSSRSDPKITHVPLIEVVPRDFSHFSIASKFADIDDYTHLILTSPNSANIFFNALNFFGISKKKIINKTFIAIGDETKKAIEKESQSPILVPKVATQEGVMDCLDLLECEKSYFFYPRSSIARPTLSFYLRVRKLRHQVCDLYDTRKKEGSELPDLTLFEEVVFSSPSVVQVFFELVENIPSSLKLTPIGPITHSALNRSLATLNDSLKGEKNYS